MQFSIELVRRGLVLGVLACAACSSAGPITHTPFAQQATDAASVMSAAGQTLRFVHGGQLTVEYGQSALFNYGEQVSDVPSELAQLSGAPDPETANQLTGLLQQAVNDLAAPCLRDDCDWSTQVSHFDVARDALLEAAE